MTFRLQIECFCEYRCTCKPIPGTKVTTQQVTYNLIRCNPALARYFSGNLATFQEKVVYKVQEDLKNPYISIVDEKKLKILLSDRQPAESSAQKENKVEIRIDNFMQKSTQYSPVNQIKIREDKVKIKKDPTQQQLRNYYKQLRLSSRYLPDTAFRKYFNRQVFQNYGRQNTHGINDGIIYGNYLKTHNINPHTGQNSPIDEQTFYHALITASPEKVRSPDTKLKTGFQNTRKDTALSRLKEDFNSQKPLKRHENNHEQIVMDNLHQFQKAKRYGHMKMSSQANKNHPPSKVSPQTLIKKYSPFNGTDKQSIKSKIQLNKSPQIQGMYVNRRQYNHPEKHKIRTNYIDRQQSDYEENFKAKNRAIAANFEIKRNRNTTNHNPITILQPNSKLADKCPVVKIKESNMCKILSKQCNVNNKQGQLSACKNQNKEFKIGQNKSGLCVCRSSHSQCKCHLTQMKDKLKLKASQDIDLNNRLITGARKATLYKNYSLNNAQNARQNPQNFKNCCEQKFFY